MTSSIRGQFDAFHATVVSAAELRVRHCAAREPLSDWCKCDGNAEKDAKLHAVTQSTGGALSKNMLPSEALKQSLQRTMTRSRVERRIARCSDCSQASLATLHGRAAGRRVSRAVRSNGSRSLSFDRGDVQRRPNNALVRTPANLEFHRSAAHGAAHRGR